MDEVLGEYRLKVTRVEGGREVGGKQEAFALKLTRAAPEQGDHQGAAQRVAGPLDDQATLIDLSDELTMSCRGCAFFILPEYIERPEQANTLTAEHWQLKISLPKAEAWPSVGLCRSDALRIPLNPHHRHVRMLFTQALKPLDGRDRCTPIPQINHR